VPISGIRLYDRISLNVTPQWAKMHAAVPQRSHWSHCWSCRMVDEVLRKAVDTAWTVYLATHRDVDVADGRPCLLERHLRGKLEASQSETEELTCFGLAYLDRLPRDE
jgi:hypothetical protein